MHRQKLRLTILLLLVSVGQLSRAADETGPGLKITPRRTGDALKVSTHDEKTVVDVTSPSGIGGAVIERSGVRWPGSMTLRLHLSGLESFRARTGKRTLSVAVGREGANERVRVWQDDREHEPLDDASPLWIEVRHVKADRNAPEAEAGAGYFELVLPRAFFAAEPSLIELDWIDFYRS